MKRAKLVFDKFKMNLENRYMDVRNSGVKSL